MSALTRIELKALWVSAFRPKQVDYANLFDSFYNVQDDSISTDKIQFDANNLLQVSSNLLDGTLNGSSVFTVNQLGEASFNKFADADKDTWFSVEGTGDEDKGIFRSAKTSGSMFELINGNDVTAYDFTADGAFTTYEIGFTSRYTKIQNNNITLYGSGAVGNYIYGNSSGYHRLPVSNGSQYHKFKRGTASGGGYDDSVLQLEGIDDWYRNMDFGNGKFSIYNELAFLEVSFSGQYDPMVLTVGFSTSGADARKGQTLILQGGGYSGDENKDAGDIHIRPGAASVGTGRDGNIILAQFSGKVIIGGYTP